MVANHDLPVRPGRLQPLPQPIFLVVLCLTERGAAEVRVEGPTPGPNHCVDVEDIDRHTCPLHRLLVPERRVLPKATLVSARGRELDLRHRVGAPIMVALHDVPRTPESLVRTWKFVIPDLLDEVELSLGTTVVDVVAEGDDVTGLDLGGDACQGGCDLALPFHIVVPFGAPLVANQEEGGRCICLLHRRQLNGALGIPVVDLSIAPRSPARTCERERAKANTKTKARQHGHTPHLSSRKL
mmetsp:Transcript_54819/g.138499  ORF Transcript_54819/g.138499 Transcript_54819/m.138499 type:complete len:241 (-) Transcript_54819:28-750(-)